MKKKVLSSLLLFVLLCTYFSAVSSAAVVEPISPLWNNIYTISIALDSEGEKGCATGTVVGKSSTELQGSLYLYKQSDSGSWLYVDSVSGNSSTRTLELTIEFIGGSGDYFKAYFVVTTMRNNVPETITHTEYYTFE